MKKRKRNEKRKKRMKFTTTRKILRESEKRKLQGAEDVKEEE